MPLTDAGEHHDPLIPILESNELAIQLADSPAHRTRLTCHPTLGSMRQSAPLYTVDGTFVPTPKS